MYIWGAVFYSLLRVFCFLCTFGAHFFTDSLFSATVCVEFTSMFYWAGMGKECKISIQTVDVE